MDDRIIYVNVGLNWIDGDDSGQFDRELCRSLVEWNFSHCGIISEPYVSTWTDSNGNAYRDNCVAFKITVNGYQGFRIAEIESKIDNIRIILKQDAIAFHACLGDVDYSDVYYGKDRPADGLIFDKNHFHYVK